ncbi:MAG: aminomethyl-transferring glycine dehydrogenase subunit GcvPB, partial [Chloroflexi bacterium]|nr:aminomethyl-transferring glycine dehydrogenase subunit GcvPB [Chloroflexota bacterium]
MKDERRRLLMDASVPGRVSCTLPDLDVPKAEMPPSEWLRQDLELPEVSEPQLVRYFTHLSQLNFAIDTNFYPLGSCSMKYNPKWHEDMAHLPGFAQIHPLQPEAVVQGALQLMYELQKLLAEITGLAATSLAPAAGAHGELTGMLLIRAYHKQRDEVTRCKVLIPDSAHGTNPASATMAGFQVVTVTSDRQGNMDLASLRAALSPEVAALMQTLPNTLGLYDPQKLEVSQAVHDQGALIY